MSKKRGGKGKQRKPSIPPLTGLRPRLDAMFFSEGWAERGTDALSMDLDSAFEGLKANEALPVLLRSYQPLERLERDRPAHGIEPAPRV